MHHSMRKIIFTLLCSAIGTVVSAQWTPAAPDGGSKSFDVRSYYKLDINKIRNQLKNAQETGSSARPVEISLPTLDGKTERFSVYSFPVMVKELAEQYKLGSYVGVGIDDPLKYVRFSVSPNDFQSMIIKEGKYEFIDPVDHTKVVYAVHPKTDKSKEGFLCSTNEKPLSKAEIEKLYENGKLFTNQPTNFAKNSDKKYRTLRLAISVTGEYTQFFGGTVDGALEAINATMTRVNGVFEKDFALHLNVQNFPGIIYTDAASDPYTGNLNLELQETLTSNVGNENYDIGHLFNAAGNNGNAGCIGCVCTDPSTMEPEGKGSGFTQAVTPEGDNFDIDFVAHEMGHQLGANHTFSHGLEGTGVNMEPGSGSTIMGYAGITGPNTDVQAHSDIYFHMASIKQVQDNLIGTTCDVETAIANNPPVIGPLSTYTIPKGTAFLLTASATDPENDPLTYTWEEVSNASITINKNNLGKTTSGASFRSLSPTSDPTRYFPKLSSVLSGVLDNSNNGWESVSMVPRTTKFAVTVRDNNPIISQQQTQFAEQTIVVGNDGPFKINTQYAGHSVPSAIEWDVVNTGTAPYNVTYVKIDYTTDNGATWSVISASTANDGTENLIFPAALDGQTIKLRISSIGNVFYAVKPINIITLATCDGSAPTGVSASNATINTVNISWIPISGAAYIIRYKKLSDTAWLQAASTSPFITLSGLDDTTAYEVQVATVCSGTQGTYSTSLNFTTLGLSYCSLAASSSVDEYISNVTLANLDNTSGASGYTNYTTDPAKLVNLVKGTINTISVTKAWSGSLYNEGVRVWIDFNRNGVFDSNEMVLESAPNKVPTVSASFTVPLTSVLNKPLRMRVALRYNTLPTACTSYGYGEVEDYNVIVNEVLGVSETKIIKDEIQIYPNPVSDILNITKVSDNASYKIYSTAGQLVETGNVNNGKIDVSSLLKGGYVITIDEKGRDHFKAKFIKK